MVVGEGGPVMFSVSKTPERSHVSPPQAPSVLLQDSLNHQSSFLWNGPSLCNAEMEDPRDERLIIAYTRTVNVPVMQRIRELPMIK